MKNRKKKTTLLLTLILFFMFAVFGGGTILNALGIQLPFMLSSEVASSNLGNTSNQNPLTQSEVVPSDIQADSINQASSQSSSTNLNNPGEKNYLNPSKDRDKSYIVELTGTTNSSPESTSSVPTPKQDTEIPPSSTSPVSSDSETTSGSASENSGGTIIPGNRPKPSPPGGGGSRLVAVQSITVDQSNVTINRKNTLQLVATVTPQNATKKTVSWTTSNKDVATVDSTGKVIGIGAGTATITAAADQKSAKCEVTVVVLMDGITLNHTELSINKGGTEQLTAKITPEDTTEDKAVTWTSSAPEIVSIDSDGKIIAHKVGKATVKASAAGASANCGITVLSPLTGIAMDKTTLTLNRHATDKLTVSFLPDDTTSGREVTWSSSAPDIADVDQQGNVIAYGIGAATIAAQCGEFTATCNVTTIALIEGIYLDQPNMTVDRGTTGQLTASIVPLDTTEDKTVIWTSSNPDIAAVDSTGNVTAIHTGTATIAARVGEHTATCNVTVVALIHSISLDKTDLTLDRSTDGQLTVSYDPPDTTEDKTVVWSSSNPDIATVDNSGKVTAVQIGTATITAKVGTHTASCSVKVVALIHNILFENSALNLDRGTDEQLTLTFDPPDTTEDKTAIWTSSNPNIATVDSTGKVTAVQIGTATITAKVGTHTTSCNLTVIALIHKIALDKSELTLDRGTTEQLTVNIEPSDTTEDKTATWTSSNPSVATVDATGKVTAVQIGTTTITATIGEHTSSCTVNVVALIKSIALDKASLTVDRGTTGQLTVSFNPADTTESKVVNWSSSDTSIATVDSTGKVTGVKIGSATVTAKVGAHTASCTVNVVALIKSITLDKNSLTLDRGTTGQLSIIINPSDTTEDKTVVWSSSNPEVATVDSSGKVTSIKIGTTTITAKIGTHTTSCSVKVVALIHNVTLNKTILALSYNTTSRLEVTINPSDTTEDRTVIWTTSDSKIATVDNTGKITALKSGTTVICAKVGSLTASCEVTVGLGYTIEVEGSSSSSVDWNFYIESDGSGKMLVERLNSGNGSARFIIKFDKPWIVNSNSTITLSGTQDTYKMGIVNIGCTEFNQSTTLGSKGDNTFSFRNMTQTTSFNQITIYISGSFHPGSDQSYAQLWLNPEGIKIDGKPILGMSGVLPINN